MPKTLKSGAERRDGELLAAVDLGSNSFHMVVARHTLGQLRIIDRIKEHVQLADGLDADRNLGAEAAQRALDCLAQFGQRLSKVRAGNVRVVATNTIRTMNDAAAFITRAEKAIGHRIEVIAGREEARLIYLGVAHDKPPGRKTRRLVIDIGGGSTEFVVGRGFEIAERESLQMGCIANIQRFFPERRADNKRWQQAKTRLVADMQPFAQTFRGFGWKEAFGASGTIRALSETAIARGLSDGTLDLGILQTLRRELLAAERFSAVRWPHMSGSRKKSIAGGLLALEAAFEALAIESLQTSDYALREGALYDMLGRNRECDPRLDSVHALQIRYAIDVEQAGRVENYGLKLFDQVRKYWDLGAADRDALSWACKLHEIGLAIAHSHHHHHGAYLIENTDISGFSKTEQHFIAVIVRNQRRSIHFKSLLSLSEERAVTALRCALLLRLSVLFHRSHADDSIPRLALQAEPSKLTLVIPKRWLDRHPLTRADLDGERAYLKHAAINLAIVEK